MRAGRRDVDRVAGFKGEEIHSQKRNEVSGVGAPVLVLEAGEEIEDVGVFAVFFLWEFLEGFLSFFDSGVVGFEDGGDEGADGFVVEMDLLGVGEEVVEGGEDGEEGLDFVGGFPAGEDFEGAEGDGDFGFVVVVSELVWVLGVESLGEVFVGVDLEGECFCD